MSKKLKQQKLDLDTSTVDTSTGEILNDHFSNGFTQPIRIKPIIRTYFNHTQLPQYTETNLLPSKTIPDQSLTPKQLLDRYSRGLPLEGIKVPLYEGESYKPDYAHLDPAEIQELRDNAREELQRLQSKMQKEEQARIYNKQKSIWEAEQKQLNSKTTHDEDKTKKEL